MSLASHCDYAPRTPAMPLGHLALVLHAHLPFVRHPEHRDHLEERWLFEALTDCYLPLVAALRRLQRDDVPCRLTVSVSPTLIEMLRDPLLCARFERHLARLDALGLEETRRTARDPALGPIARFHADRARALRTQWEHLHHDLVAELVDLSRAGLLELWTTTATHGLLPSLAHHPAVVNAHIATGLDAFRRATGLTARGLWLPECGFSRGLDATLVRHGITCTTLETHALLHAEPRPHAPGATPIVTPAGLACFARDVTSSRQVWSRDEGYPGDPWYRDFHSDLGFTRPLPDFTAADGARLATGFKYHRVGDKRSPHKPLYDPQRARERALAHAEHFVASRVAHLTWLSAHTASPVVLAPYDAELFGHWWYEGPYFLEALFRALALQRDIAPVTPLEYLALHPTHDLCTPEDSTWGDGGDARVWLDPSTAWMLRHVDHACAEMTRLAHAHRGAAGLVGRALRQAARETLLLTASDWPFLIRTRGAPHYARARFDAHLVRFLELARMIRDGAVTEPFLKDIEARDNPFQHIDPDWFVLGDLA